MGKDAMKASIARSYHEHKAWVIRTAISFQDLYGGDLDEIIAEATLHFVKACYAYCPEKAAMTNWTRVCMWNGLKRWSYKEHKNKFLRIPKDVVIIDPNNSIQSIELFDWLKGLDDDAAVVARLLLDTPPELKQLLHDEPRQIINSLRKYLVNKNWSENRVNKTVRRLKSTLKGK